MDRLAAMENPDLHEDLEEAVEVRLPGIPCARVNLNGIMVVFKPENWEVNRGNPDMHRGDVEWRLLSDWVAAALPRSKFPLVHSSEFDFGFIHRLDVPSSGLIMSAKSFAGQALLRWQLDTYELEREYIVACHGPFLPTQRDIILRLSMDKDNAKSYVSAQGAPARTRVSCLAYVFPLLDADTTCSLVAIKIHTGRHHQIRAHLTHLEHVTAGDGKYGRRSATLQDQYIYGDMIWFESFFGRPAVLNFLDAGPNREKTGEHSSAHSSAHGAG